MPVLDILSFKCLDEQDGSTRSSDEVYAKIEAYYPAGTYQSGTITGVDRNETHQVNMNGVSIPNGAYVTLWEDDAGGVDDLLAGFEVSGASSRGVFERTFEFSGAKYELTYVIA